MWYDPRAIPLSGPLHDRRAKGTARLRTVSKVPMVKFVGSVIWRAAAVDGNDYMAKCRCVASQNDEGIGFTCHTVFSTDEHGMQNENVIGCEP